MLTADRGWVLAGQLVLGARVVTLNGGTATITALVGHPGEADYYNLTVSQLHTYAVGTSQVVVHNCPAPNDIIKYSDKAPGLEKHHGVMDAWAKSNINGYKGGSAPTVVLTKADHAATKSVFNQWKYARMGTYFGSVDWGNVSAGEIQDLSESMFAAANVPRETRSAYYRAFNKYLYTGGW